MTLLYFIQEIKNDSLTTPYKHMDLAPSTISFSQKQNQLLRSL